MTTVFIAGDPLVEHAEEARLPVSRSIERVLGHLAAVDGQQQPPAVRVLSGIGAGVDDIAMSAAGRLQVPLHVLGFESDSVDTQSAEISAERVVLLPGAADLSLAARNEMMVARDELALSYSDILIAVRDSRLADGRSVRLIREAVMRGMPVIAVGLDGIVRQIPSLNARHGVSKHVSCSEPDADMLESLMVCYDTAACNLALPTRHAGAFPDTAAGEVKPGNRGSRVRKPGILHDVFAALSTLDAKGARKAWARDRSADYYGVSIAEIPEPLREQHPIAEPEALRSAFRVHDVAANHYAGLHRDMTWIVYGMSALAVFAAVSGEIGLGGAHSAVFWGVVEFLLLAGILASYSLARKGDWHRLWLVNRYSAEVIRYARVSCTVLAPPDILRDRFSEKSGGHDLHDDGCGRGDETGALRRLLVDVGLPCSRDQSSTYRPGEHLDACVRYLRHVVSDQISYHERKSDESHRIAHALHLITHACFMLTGVAVIGHLVFHFSGLLLMTAALPAFAAAVHGIATQNEFGRLAAMSHATASDLSVLLAALDHDQGNGKSAAHGWLLVNRVTAEAVRVMSGSARQWQEIVLQRSTSLPS